MSLPFTCPDCGKHTIEEVMTGVVVTSNIISVSDGSIDYGLKSCEEGEVCRYQCVSCGFIICWDENSDAINDPEMLCEWLEDQDNKRKGIEIARRQHEQLIEQEKAEANRRIDYPALLGKKVVKTRSNDKEPKPFKSGSKINTVKGIILHPQLGISAFIFEEDDSYVECRRIVEATRNQILEWHDEPDKLDEPSIDDVEHIEECEIGENWIHCPACIQHHNETCAENEKL